MVAGGFRAHSGLLRLDTVRALGGGGGGEANHETVRRQLPPSPFQQQPNGSATTG